MSLAYRVSAFNRRRKWNRFIDEMAPTQATRVLDIGFSDKEYSDTDNFIEKHYPYPRMLTALGVDEPAEFPRRYPEVKAVRYAGDAFPFADNEFDVCWSNAVIEHVGTHERQVLFLREIARVGRRAYITTPNRFFPVEVHTRIPLLHYLPKPWFDAILRRIGKEWAAGDYMYLLSLSELKAELRAAGIERFKIFRNRLLGFTLDFVVVVEPGNPS